MSQTGDSRFSILVDHWSVVWAKFNLLRSVQALNYAALRASDRAFGSMKFSVEGYGWNPMNREIVVLGEVTPNLLVNERVNLMGAGCS